MERVVGLGDGIWRFTLPLPFAAPRSVNCYAFEAPDGITLLDCGVDTDDGHDHLVSCLAEIGAGPCDVHRVVGSHLHVDHIAMAKRLIDETGAEWVMHESTPDEVPLYNDWERRRHRLADIAEANGAPGDVLTRFRTDFDRPDWYSSAVDPTHPVADGDRLLLGRDRYLQVLYTPGHQPNHITLVDSHTRLVFSGDHILPGISPFVPYDGGDRDHLGDYLDSLERIELLDPGIVLPAHGPTIDRGRARARQIGLHHERRLGAILQELKWGPKTAWDVMEAVFRPNLNFVQQRLAIQETLAHLEYLTRRGMVDRIYDQGVFWFRKAR